MKPRIFKALARDVVPVLHKPAKMIFILNNKDDLAFGTEIWSRAHAVPTIYACSDNYASSKTCI